MVVFVNLYNHLLTNLQVERPIHCIYMFGNGEGPSPALCDVRFRREYVRRETLEAIVIVTVLEK
jgi:hypothetical protein